MCSLYTGEKKERGRSIYTNPSSFFSCDPKLIWVPFRQRASSVRGFFSLFLHALPDIGGFPSLFFGYVICFSSGLLSFCRNVFRYGLEFSFGDSLAQERFHHQWVLASLWICEEAVDFVARGWSWLLRFRELFSVPSWPLLVSTVSSEKWKLVIL